MSTPSNFDSFATAMEFHALMKAIADAEIDQLRPMYRYGFVTSVDYATRKCQVQLNAQDAIVTVNIGALGPQIGQLVRISGVVGDFFVSDVFDVSNSVGVVLQNAILEKAAVGGAALAGTNFCVVASAQFTHNQKATWMDLPWTIKDTKNCIEDDGVMIDVGGVDFTMPIHACYHIDMGFTFSSGGVVPGQYGVRLVYSDTGRVLRDIRHDAAATSARILSLQWKGPLDAGQKIKFQAYQDANTSINILGQTSTQEFGCRIDMRFAIPVIS